jgi:hypothetical protein
MQNINAIGCFQLTEEIVVILCELEMYFPPSFFDIVVHLMVHIVDEIQDLARSCLST